MLKKDNQKLDPFVEGLSHIIKTSWNSQKEFAEDIMSTVNLSKILNYNGGISLKLKKKMATKAETTVEDIIELGNKLIQPNLNPAINQVIELKTGKRNKHTFHGNVAEMNTTEIYSETQKISKSFIKSMHDHVDSLTNVIHALTVEKEKLIKDSYQNYQIFNANDAAFKVVDEDLNVVFCNKVNTEMFAQFPNGTCTLNEDGSPDNATKTVIECFATGRRTYKVAKENNKWYFYSAHPIRYSASKPDNVLVIIREAEIYLRLAFEAGWKPSND